MDYLAILAISWEVKGDEPAKRHMISFSITLALLMVVVAGVQGAAAQNATPAGGSKFAGMGIQELHVVADDTAFHAPAAAKAGLTVLTLENQGKTEASASIGTPKSGETVDQLMQEVATPVSADTTFLKVAYDIELSGGPVAQPGQTSEVLINLKECDHIIAGEGSQMPAKIHVTAAEGTPAPEPSADLTVEMKEYTFAGLTDQVTAGDHLMKLTNTGTQPHIMVILIMPAGTTSAQFQGLLQAEITGTPMAGPTPAFDETSFQTVAGTEVRSTGNSLWVPLHLDPGTYGVACFIPDKDTGVPHAAMGMAQVITVS
ncbi:MAG: hypothetical protein ACJ789_00085 [Thermomicrobiales bacterium]